MSRPNVYEGEFPMQREEMGIRGRPFAPVPEGGDEGVVAMFRAQDNLRKPAS